MRTDEEAKAIETRLEKEIDEAFARVYKSLHNPGETRFTRFVVITALARIYERLVEEDMETSLAFDAPTKAAAHKAVGAIVARCMEHIHKEMAPHRN